MSKQPIISPKRALKMYAALYRIAKSYQTPEQLVKNCKKQYGIDPQESLEMAYDNIQQEAKDAINGIRFKNIKL